MIQLELTSKLVLAIIGITSVSAILVPTYAVPTIRSADIFNETILSEDIKNGEVKAEDIAAGVIPSGGGQPNVHVVVSDSVTAGPGQFGIADLDCPSGEKVTGGGFQAFTNGFAVESLPADEDTWHVKIDNTRDVESVFRVYAVCMGPAS